MIRIIAHDNNRDDQVKNKAYVDDKRCIARKYYSGHYVKNIDTTPGENKKYIPKVKALYEVKVIWLNNSY